MQDGIKCKDDGDADRRAFLAKCGRFATVVPPAMTVLLSTSLSSNAIARSSGGEGNSNGLGGDVPRGLGPPEGKR